ncbi:Putative oxidoreductase GLYR1 like protein [Trachymyrmex cornetzi]|uniref:Putative oxidoreductase GLYR1 like protein n=1 Tax=Trachymyrmex cornetzi TaxID=471704 RepID=A0A151J3V6_9HYME|nr:Putative oxidoreductase GLYR1 like protein [Trachymyrmex cornetzi]
MHVKVSVPSKDLKKPANAKKGPVQCIFFFGTNNYAWIEESHIKPYQEYKDTLVKSSKSGAFKDAVEAIEDFIAKGEVFEDGLDPDSLFDRLKEETISEKKTPVVKTPKPRKETAAKTTKRLSDSGTERRPAKKQRRESSNSNGNRLGSISPTLNHSSSARKTGSLLNRPANIARPVTPPLDVETMSQTLREKNILPSTLKFGFLGLGIMGSGIVKNLINSGHSVIVWNRTQEKENHCEKHREPTSMQDTNNVENNAFVCFAMDYFYSDLARPGFSRYRTGFLLRSPRCRDQLHGFYHGSASSCVSRARLPPPFNGRSISTCTHFLAIDHHRQSSISKERSPVSWHSHEFFLNCLLEHSPRISHTVKSGRSFERSPRHRRRDFHLSNAGNPFLATLTRFNFCRLKFSLAWKIGIVEAGNIVGSLRGGGGSLSSILTPAARLSIFALKYVSIPLRVSLVGSNTMESLLPHEPLRQLSKYRFGRFSSTLANVCC